MSDLQTWHDYANHTVFPFIVEKDDTNMLVYRRGSYDVRKKPDKWKQAMAIVNGDCVPIPPEMVEAIDTLIQVRVDQWNPWPVLAGMKDKLDITLRTDDEAGLVIKRIDDGTTSVTLKVGNAAAIWTKWNRIGFEHDRLVWFAALLTPIRVNLADPWLGLMQWKQEDKARLDFENGGTIKISIVGTCGGIKNWHIGVPPGVFTFLVPLFNSEGVPPGCTTAWSPFLSADEAIALLKAAYDTPEFDKLLARVKDGKLLRSH